jgi:hypothetical protein
MDLYANDAFPPNRGRPMARPLRLAQMNFAVRQTPPARDLLSQAIAAAGRAVSSPTQSPKGAKQMNLSSRVL